LTLVLPVTATSSGAFQLRLYEERNVLGLIENGQVPIDGCAVWVVGDDALGDEDNGWAICHIEDVGGLQMRRKSLVFRGDGLYIDSERSGHVAVVSGVGSPGDARESSPGRGHSPHRLVADGNRRRGRQSPVSAKRVLDSPIRAE
jgi:hypothetical protein